MVANEFKMGFCPTMTNIAQAIGKSNKNISLFPLGSAAEALYYVKNGVLDGVVIGRIAKTAEISESVERLPLQTEGVTLVARQKGFINYKDLNQVPIVTYLDQQVVKTVIPNTKNIQYVSDFTETMAELNFSNAALIKWSDYNDSLELLIPVDENGNKIISFRLPTLYYQTDKKSIVKNLVLDIM